MPGFSMGQMGFSTRSREMTDGAAEKRDRKLPPPPSYGGGATSWDRMDAQQQARLNPAVAAESRDLAAATAPQESTYESYMAEQGLPEQQDIFSILSKPQVEPGGGVRRYGSVPGTADGANQRKAIQNAPRYEEYLQRDPKVQTYRQKLEDAYNDLSTMGPMDNMVKGKVQRQKIQALQSNYELALNDAKLRLADADSTYKASLPKYDVVNTGGGTRVMRQLPNQMPQVVQELDQAPEEWVEDTPHGRFKREKRRDGSVVSVRVPTEAEAAAADLTTFGKKAKITADETIRMNAAGVTRSGSNVSTPGGGVDKSELLQLFDANGRPNQNFDAAVDRRVQARTASWPDPPEWDTEAQEKKMVAIEKLRKEIGDGYIESRRRLGAGQGSANAAGVKPDGTVERSPNGSTFEWNPKPSPAPSPTPAPKKK